MMDTSNWKEFRVGDLFHAIRGTTRKIQSLKEGKTALISASGANQGISGYFGIPAEYENAITVSCNGATGSTFYHDYPFAITGDVVVLKNLTNITPHAMLYITTIFNMYFTGKYSYNNKCSGAKIEAELVKLPATPEGQPDWEYMENHMKKVMEDSEKKLENLRKINHEKHLIDTSNWKEFRVGDLFAVSRTKTRIEKTYKEGDVPFVASGCFNNGVTAYLTPKDESDFDEENCITVSPLDGSSFYQEKRFLGRGGSGTSIIILRNKSLNRLRGLFICTIIRNTCNKWNYADTGSIDKLENTRIKLPATPDGQPDWEYMENYMKNIMEQTEKKLTMLQSCL